MAKRCPQAVGKFRELRHTLGQMRLESLAVGADGRNRCLLSPFASRTGRNQPSNSKYIFGPSNWLRSLIKPTAGNSIAYLDWSQQEFGIAAAFSHDANMLEAYRSGDPYLAFAKQAGAVPDHATKTITQTGTRIVQGLHARGPIRDGCRIIIRFDWRMRRYWPRAFAIASTNVAKVLALVGGCGRSCNDVRLPTNGIRLAFTRWGRLQPAFVG